MYCTMCLKFYFYDEATFPSLINIISVIYLSNNTDILCHHSIIVIQKWIDTNTITLFNYRFKLFTYPVRNTSIGSVIRFLSLQREMVYHNRKNKNWHALFLQSHQRNVLVHINSKDSFVTKLLKIELPKNTGHLEEGYISITSNLFIRLDCQ